MGRECSFKVWEERMNKWVVKILRKTRWWVGFLCVAYLVGIAYLGRRRKGFG